MKPILFSLACILMLMGNPAAAMQIEVRDDLWPRLQSLVFVYPPADPADYTGESRNPDPDTPLPDVGFPLVIRLSGVIEKGDADKFIQFMETNWTYGMSFVFDSPGGNFLEALKIGSFLKDMQDPSASDPAVFGFYVLNGEQCMSACALILALGGGPGNAYIEQGGVAGFHMGILPDDKAESTAKVRDVMNLTYDIVSEFTLLIEDGGQQPTLLREALKHRDSQSFYYLRGGMRSWQMGFTPRATEQSAPQINQVGFDNGTAHRVCSALMFASRKRLADDARNLLDSYGDQTPVEEDAATRLQDVFDRLQSNHIYRAFPSEFHSVLACNFSRDAQGNVSVGVIGMDYTSNTNTIPECLSSQRENGWCAIRELPAYPLRVPLLANALGCSAGTLQTAIPQDTDNWSYGFAGWEDEDNQRKGKAKRDVNIRATPGLDTAPIATLRQGTSAEILDCALTGDKQGLFFKVQAGEMQGWVSARFMFETWLFSHPVTN